MSLNNRVRSFEHSRNMEDCRVVPPRNDKLFTLAPFAVALGNKTSCHRERSEAIFNCLFSYESGYNPEEHLYAPN